MQRIIKFRVWNKTIYPDRLESTVISLNNTGWVNITSETNGGIDIFTGLHDKNGKEVYEGDVLYHKGVNYAVEWKNYKWRFRKANGNGHPFMQLYNHPENFEVVGNIYEHSHLLDNKTKKAFDDMMDNPMDKLNNLINK